MTAILALPVGRVAVHSRDDTIDGIEYLPPGTALIAARSAPARAFAAQLQEYLASPGLQFDVPLADDHGTEHQRRVWRRLRTIPAGAPLSYGVLAAELGSGARAVAGACRSNPFPLVVPCHRVLAKSGIGGFAGHSDGWRVELKQWLIEHERRAAD